MPSQILSEQAQRYIRAVPDIRPGYTIRVHERITEGEKERIQVFEGLIIGIHRGHVPTDASFTVRRIVSGIGVEKVFSLHSPRIEKIDVIKIANVRRAKLTFLRGRHGKGARLSERFTKAEEFAAALAAPDKKEEAKEASVSPLPSSRQ